MHHSARGRANELFLLFRSWLREQFNELGFEAEADELAMHVLARSQGIASLANAFHDDKFIKREVELMSDWLTSQMNRAVGSVG
jgi:hypothetical protein